jgi:RNA polymerase sigma factor (sigma-70 family)
MAIRTINSLVPFLRTLGGLATDSSMSDGQLLRRFADQGDESAFAALVNRHGSMVLGVARRVLHDRGEAEDVYQATFLVLARKAGSVCWRESVAPWLYEVAHRLAKKANIAATRRRARELEASGSSCEQSRPDASWREVCTALDEEILRLPARQRQPLLLCYFEGETRDQAARHLGWSVRTLERRLQEGRESLRQRLARRGLELSGLLLAASVGQRSVRAAVPAVLGTRTVRAICLSGGNQSSLDFSTRALALANSVAGNGGKFLLKLALMTVAVLSISVVAAYPARESSPAREAGGVENQAVAPLAALDKDPLPAGAIARLGTTRFRNGFVTYRIAFAPNGKSIACASAGAGVALWGMATGKELHHFLESRHIYGVAFSPDGKVLACPGAGKVTLFEAETGKEIRQLAGNQGGTTMCVAFSPDGKILASGGHDRLVRLWDTATGKELRQLEGHEDTVREIAFSADNSTLVSWSPGKSIRFWNVPRGRQVGSISAGDKVKSVAFSTGDWIASGDEDGTIHLWSRSTMKELRTMQVQVEFLGDAGYRDAEIEKNQRQVECLEFSPDGKRLAASTRDGGITLLDAASGKTLSRWRAHTFGGAFPAKTLAFSPDGATLASGAFWVCGPRFWDTATGKELHVSPGHRGLVDLVAYAPDGRTLYSVSRDKVLLQWDLASGEAKQLFEWRSGSLDRAVLSPDRRTLALWEWFFGHIRLHDTSGQRPPRLLGQFKGKPNLFSRFALAPGAFSPDGKTYFGVCLDGTVRCWDVATGRLIWERKQTAKAACLIDLSPDGKLLALGFVDPNTGAGQDVFLWDAKDGKEVRTLGCDNPASALVFSPDGQTLASIGDRDQGILWDVASGKQLRRFSGVKGECHALTFSPDGRWLAAAGSDYDKLVHLWEVATGLEVKRLPGHQCGCMSVAFAPDGLTLASGGSDSQILIWDMTGRMKEGRLAPAHLSPKELASRWKDLADGVDRSVPAVWDFAASSNETVPFLREKLRIASPPSQDRLALLLRDLDSDRFAAREKATAELTRLGMFAESALRDQLDRRPSLEMRSRVEQLLSKLQPASNPELLRQLRAVQALEYAGTPAAQHLLESLADGPAQSLLSREAGAAVRRLTANSKARSDS